MNLNVTIDWKFALALGGAISGIILSLKVDSDGAKEVLTHAANTSKECVVAGNGSH